MLLLMDTDLSSIHSIHDTHTRPNSLVMLPSQTQLHRHPWQPPFFDYHMNHSFTWPSPHSSASVEHAASAEGVAAGARAAEHLAGGAAGPPRGPGMHYHYYGQGGWPGYRRHMRGRRLLWVGHGDVSVDTTDQV